ncbi:hypothetical protein FA95DRAFT_1605622 [Auriscalpium vulgare]|uniref:Uncharacterized protein n=1 Tax=Auriscalpium vulgare TaxID=40419 RepID=A0ACB8RVX1_9AGAM|nr:hypothetical protein FA95DRAFT_1605622 [Auriscalpium vulgare]
MPPDAHAHADDASDPLMPSDDQLPRPERRHGDAPAAYAASASAGVLAAATWAIVLSSDPRKLGWFAFHPTLNSLAIFSFTLAILTLQPTSQPKTKAAGLQKHQIAALVGLLAVFSGTTAMFINKDLHGSAHITTWHGLFGLIAFLWFIVQLVLGAGSVWSDGALFGGGIKAKLVWKYHRLSGYLLLPLVLFTAHLGGGWSTWATGQSASFVRLITYTVAPAVILVSLYSRVRPSKMRFF